MKHLHHIIIALAFGTLLFFSSCRPASADHPGVEYMPDMGHSVAYESNVVDDYFAHTWDDKFKGQTREELSQPRNPVAGTIPRGYSSVANAGSPQAREAAMAKFANETVPIPVNGFVPYYYGNTEEERVRATAEITSNPFPATEKRLASGKALYDIYCGICHGPQADGNGYLAREDGGKYPVQPANLMADNFVNTTDGQYYHAIMYGKNVMGGYADKLSYEERWNVIHYIRSIQANAKGEDYGKASIDPVGGQIPEAITVAEAQPDVEQTAQVVEQTKTVEKVEVKGSGAIGNLKAGEAMTLKNVNFALGSAKLKPESMGELDKIAAYLKANPTVKGELGGHTDSRGNKQVNQDLSEKRAKSVLDYLVSKGASAANLTAKGYGSSSPKSTDKTPAARKMNRRTEFKVLN